MRKFEFEVGNGFVYIRLPFIGAAIVVCEPGIGKWTGLTSSLIDHEGELEFWWGRWRFELTSWKRLLKERKQYA